MKQSIDTKVSIVTAAFAMLLSTAAFAQDSSQGLNYNYLELNYVYGEASVKSDSFSDKANSDTFRIAAGLQAKGSILFAEQFLARGSYYYSAEDTWKDTADVDVTSGVIGIGWLVPTNDDSGIDIGMEYRTDEFEYDPKNGGDKVSPDIDGFGFVFGVRLPSSANTEVGLRAGWYQGDFDGAVGVELNFAWNIDERWGLNVSYERIDADPDSDAVYSYELNQTKVGGRYYF